MNWPAGSLTSIAEMVALPLTIPCCQEVIGTLEAPVFFLRFDFSS